MFATIALAWLSCWSWPAYGREGPRLGLKRDSWLPAFLCERYGEALANVRVSRVADAGHWPWLERPDVAETIAAFVAAR